MSATPRVAAVIACFDPPDSLVEAVREAAVQTDLVVAVDDGSVGTTDVFVRLGACGATVLHQANAGIAAALNAGIRVAREQGADVVLTLDQDSRLGSGYVAAALATLAAAAAGGIPVGFVSAESYSGHRAPTDGWAGRGVDARVPRAFDPMQSGWVVPLTTFDRLGPLEEDLVIDGVDSEFTARCRAAGLDPVIGPGCLLGHGQGERMPARLLGRPVVVRGVALAYNRHVPIRVYYMTRNGTVITRRHLLRQPRWVMRRLVEEATAHGIRLVFDPQRGRLLVATLAGWRDGLRGRTGRIPSDLERRLR